MGGTCLINQTYDLSHLEEGGGSGGWPSLFSHLSPNISQPYLKERRKKRRKTRNEIKLDICLGQEGLYSLLTRFSELNKFLI